MSTRVKICGVTNPIDAGEAAAAGAWAIGLNFFAGSKRCVSPEAAAEITASLPPEIERVGVFVNAGRGEVERIAYRVGLTMLQFHGDESPADCSGWSMRTIRAVRWRGAESLPIARAYAVDFILADAYVEGAFGGTGMTVEPGLLAGLEADRLILAGGLTAENVVDAIRLVRPFAVDVASGVESSPGRKNVNLIRRFIQNAHSA